MHSTRRISSPFDGLIIELSAGIFDLRDDERKKRATEIDAKSFIIHQLGLLRVEFINLVETGIHTFEEIERNKKTTPSKIPISEFALEGPMVAYKVVLFYYSFINVLNQLNRALPKYFKVSTPIPYNKRIRFYRNKVVEHWDEYTTSIGSNGYVFTKGKPSIPSGEQAHLLKERRILLEELKVVFSKLGANFPWEKDAFSLIGSNQEYSELVFSAVEQTGKIDYRIGQDNDFDNLIRLLFQLGFPVPITDVEVYGKELVSHLQKLIKENLKPPTRLPQIVS